MGVGEDWMLDDDAGSEETGGRGSEEGGDGKRGVADRSGAGAGDGGWAGRGRRGRRERRGEGRAGVGCCARALVGGFARLPSVLGGLPGRAFLGWEGLAGLGSAPMARFLDCVREVDDGREEDHGGQEEEGREEKEGEEKE